MFPRLRKFGSTLLFQNKFWIGPKKSLKEKIRT